MLFDLEFIPVNESTEHYRMCKLWLEDNEITKWLTSVLRVGKYFRLTHEMLTNKKNAKIYFIKTNNRYQGLIGLFNIDKIDRRAEIFYLIGEPSERSKGIATRAVSLFSKKCMNEFNLNMIYANVVELNIASIKVLKKNNFKYAGRFRRAFNFEGNYRELLFFDFVHADSRK